MDMGKLRNLSEHRVCPECRAEFRTIPASNGNQEIPALVQFSDHLTLHQPTATQWTEAHNRIQDGKERAKRAG
jgi:uncharacterized protein with PIN domain